MDDIGGVSSPQRTRSSKPAEPEGPAQGSIQAAIKQQKPFRSRSQEALVGLLLTTETVRWPLLDLLANHEDLTPQQYNVLRILRGAGPPGLATLEIGARMIERTPGVTRLLDRLADKGLVDRTRPGDDRRKVICTITERGLALLRRLDRPVDALDEAVMASLTPAELDEFIRLLDKIRLANTRA